MLVINKKIKFCIEVCVARWSNGLRVGFWICGPQVQIMMVGLPLDQCVKIYSRPELTDIIILASLTCSSSSPHSPVL